MKEKHSIYKGKHCSNCGADNPAIIEYAAQGDEGFTSCCNEALCDGITLYVFGNETVSVKACCWASAEKQFIAQGVDVLTFDTMQRFEE